MDIEIKFRKNLELLKELKPGEPGTEELMERFGDALVCVRLWYDPERDLQLTTAEVVEARRPRWLRRHPGKTLEPRSPRRSG
jgi:hypothetical protein